MSNDIKLKALYLKDDETAVVFNENRLLENIHIGALLVDVPKDSHIYNSWLPHEWYGIDVPRVNVEKDNAFVLDNNYIKKHIRKFGTNVITDVYSLYYALKSKNMELYRILVHSGFNVACNILKSSIMEYQMTEELTASLSETQAKEVYNDFGLHYPRGLKLHAK